MTEANKILDVVALVEDIPGLGLVRGQVGTVVERHGPDALEVEFGDTSGRSYAMLVLHPRQFLVLHYERAQAT